MTWDKLKYISDGDVIRLSSEPQMLAYKINEIIEAHNILVQAIKDFLEDLQ